MNLSEAVFTTKYVIEDRSPIVYTIHDSEGEWQFFGPEKDVPIEHARIVSLGEILEMDPTIKDILWLPDGVDARRVQPGAEWATGIYLGE